MKKVKFYSLMRRDGKPAAILHDGYTDGVYYYYKNNNYCNIWYVIHPDTGLSLTYGVTRKEAAEKAYAPDMVENVKKVIASRGEQMRAAFDKAIEETQNRIEEATA